MVSLIVIFTGLSSFPFLFFLLVTNKEITTLDYMTIIVRYYYHAFIYYYYYYYYLLLLYIFFILLFLLFFHILLSRSVLLVRVPLDSVGFWFNVGNSPVFVYR